MLIFLLKIKLKFGKKKLFNLPSDEQPFLCASSGHVQIPVKFEQNQIYK